MQIVWNESFLNSFVLCPFEQCMYFCTVISKKCFFFSNVLKWGKSVWQVFENLYIV